jgi:hypothetical protein
MVCGRVGPIPINRPGRSPRSATGRIGAKPPLPKFTGPSRSRSADARRGGGLPGNPNTTGASRAALWCVRARAPSGAARHDRSTRRPRALPEAWPSLSPDTCGGTAVLWFPFLGSRPRSGFRLPGRGQEVFKSQSDRPAFDPLLDSGAFALARSAPLFHRVQQVPAIHDREVVATAFPCQSQPTLAQRFDFGLGIAWRGLDALDRGLRSSSAA